MDIRAQQAREHHREAGELDAQAARRRELRDRLIRQLRADDPRRWTYPALAAAVGCSPELIAHIVKTGADD
jgi:AraC-like DNA-binding protein